MAARLSSSLLAAASPTANNGRYRLLGASLFDPLGLGFGGRGLFTHVAAYTVLHFAAFISIGVIAAFVMNVLDRD